MMNSSRKRSILWNGGLSVLMFMAIQGCQSSASSEEREEAERPQKLQVLPEMIINEVAKGDAGMLVDEQQFEGKTPQGQPETSWSVNVREGEVGWYLPANAVIDLGREHVISKIGIYRGDGIAGNIHFNYGIPFRWDRVLTDSLSSKNKWTVHQSGNIQTRYLQISKETDADLREIVLYGYPVGPKPEPKPEVVRKKVPLTQAIGINAHYLDPHDKVQVADFVREYHNWPYNEGGFTQNYPGYPNNQTQWNPSSTGASATDKIVEWNPALAKGPDFDAYYKRMKEDGILVFPCIQSTVPWLNGDPDKRSRKKPIPAGSDPTDPASYAAHADYMFQYAARYGSTPVEDEKLKLAPNQERKSGLGYLEYYENWNEPDGWWGGRSDYFSPYEYAAMSSADYDGHESTMGDDKGIVNADPKAKLVMSGIASPNPDYLRAMKFWFEHNRTDKKFVFDIISVHHYCNSSGGQAQMRKGISPEEDGLKSIMQKITDFRDKHTPGREVWMTEFGWDTNPATSQAAPSKEVQGQWLVRGFLACLAGGMDRVAMYMLSDTNPKSEGNYSSSGLIGPRHDPTAKLSWDYLHTLRNELSGLVFHREETSSVEDVRIYSFKDPDTQRGVYVLWCPTSKGTEVQNYSLSLGEKASMATLVEMQEGKKNGLAKKLAVTAGTVQLDVSERPVFVQVDQMP